MSQGRAKKAGDGAATGAKKRKPSAGAATGGGAKKRAKSTTGAAVTKPRVKKVKAAAPAGDGQEAEKKESPRNVQIEWHPPRGENKEGVRKAPFRRLLTQAAHKYVAKLRFGSGVVGASQGLIEEDIVRILTGAAAITRHARRHTVTKADIELHMQIVAPKSGENADLLAWQSASKRLGAAAGAAAAPKKAKKPKAPKEPKAPKAAAAAPAASTDASAAAGAVAEAVPMEAAPSAPVAPAVQVAA
jgi:histone H3/H4